MLSVGCGMLICSRSKEKSGCKAAAIRLPLLCMLNIGEADDAVPKCA